MGCLQWAEMPSWCDEVEITVWGRYEAAGICQIREQCREKYSRVLQMGLLGSDPKDILTRCGKILWWMFKLKMYCSKIRKAINCPLNSPPAFPQACSPIPHTFWSSTGSSSRSAFSAAVVAASRSWRHSGPFMWLWGRRLHGANQWWRRWRHSEVF